MPKETRKQAINRTIREYNKKAERIRLRALREEWDDDEKSLRLRKLDARYNEDMIKLQTDRAARRGHFIGE